MEHKEILENIKNMFEGAIKNAFDKYKEVYGEDKDYEKTNKFMDEYLMLVNEGKLKEAQELKTKFEKENG